MKFDKKFKKKNESSRGSWFSWQTLIILANLIILPWTIYVMFHSKYSILNASSISMASIASAPSAVSAHFLSLSDRIRLSMNTEKTKDNNSVKTVQASKELSVVMKSSFPEYASIPVIPVLGAPPTHGARPLFGRQHNNKNDAVFALACKYPKEFFQRFVGSLRKFGYPGDVVLAVSPPDQMKPGVGEYLQLMNVIAYAFDVDCNGKDSCRLKDEFLGYPDPRPYRTFANIRYALYEYWIRYYSEQSYILILDFRDTFFQADPFQSFGYPVSNRVAKYDLQVYAENYKVYLLLIEAIFGMHLCNSNL